MYKYTYIVSNTLVIKMNSWWDLIFIHQLRKTKEITYALLPSVN